MYAPTPTPTSLPTFIAHLDHVLYVIPIVVLTQLQRDRHLAAVGMHQVNNCTRATAAGTGLGRQVLYMTRTAAAMQAK